MIAILTGDLIKSQKEDAKIWLPTLKEALNHFGRTPKQWEIYRGDSFQLETSATEALTAALLLKASLKTHKKLDVRMAIGLGEKSHNAANITEANGTAFVHSGQCFDQLKKHTLAIQSAQTDFNTEFNLLFRLATLTMNSWPPVTARIVKTAILNPEMDQSELAALLDKDQPYISRALKRAGYEELLQLNQHYKHKLSKL